MDLRFGPDDSGTWELRFDHRGFRQLLPEQWGQRVPAHRLSKQLNRPSQLEP